MYDWGYRSYSGNWKSARDWCNKKSSISAVYRYNPNRSDKGNWYNVYAQKHTDKYDDKTYNDKKIEVDTPNKKKADEVDNQSVEEGITIKLMA